MTRGKAREARISLLVCAFVASIYLLSYRATIQTGDALRSLDATTSFLRFGDWLMDESSWSKPAHRVRAASPLPLSEYDVDERLHILLAAPLLKLAEAVPRLGNIHTVWLFNIIVTAASASLLYLIVRQLSYERAPAVLVALSAGLGSNLWAYSQTFFREPLAMFFLLLACYAVLLGSGAPKRRRLLSLAAASGCITLAALTKYSALLALPGLLVLALSPREGDSRRQANLAALALGLMAGLALFFILLEPLPPAFAGLLTRFGLTPRFAGQALRAYLLSPGASIWGTSPIALLALAGSVMLWRGGRYWLVVSIWLVVFGYAFGHALLTGEHWFGGLSMPPRFLLPALPILALAAAPLAQRIFASGQRRLRAIWLALLLYGFWIQFCAVSLDLAVYSDSLPPGAPTNAEWGPALLQPRYFRWVVLPQRWADLGLGFLWTRAGISAWGLSFALYAAAAAALLFALLRNPSGRWRHAALPLCIFCIPLTLLNLSLAYDKDPRANARQQALHEALDFLAENAEGDDVLLLPGNRYRDFILNYLDEHQPRPVILTLPLAQAPSDKQPALVTSQNPNDWFDVRNTRIIRHLAERHDRLWLLANTSRAMAWSFQPLERYLARHYYPLRQIPLATADDSVRLYEVSTAQPAPNPLSPYSGDIATDLRYGEQIRLAALTLPAGRRYQPGEVIALSLLWRADTTPERDYTVAWFIADAGGQQPVAQGYDSAPQFNYAPTSSWRAGEEIWDQRALRLPARIAPGEYQMWIVLYTLAPAQAGTIPLPVRGAQTAGEGTIGILPVTLLIE